MKKENCWEYMKCGRGDAKAEGAASGSCPAAVEQRLHGIHGGINAGRACWLVAGTHCDGGVSGTFARKIKDCKECNFYQKVFQEEDHRVVISREVLDILT